MEQNKAHGFGICFHVQSPNICDPKSSFSKNKDLASGKWFLQESLLTRNFLKRFKKNLLFQETSSFWFLGNAKNPTDLKPYWSRAGLRHPEESKGERGSNMETRPCNFFTLRSMRREGCSVSSASGSRLGRMWAVMSGRCTIDEEPCLHVYVDHNRSTLACLRHARSTFIADWANVGLRFKTSTRTSTGWLPKKPRISKQIRQPREVQVGIGE